jgi:hypothetical protein
VCYRHHEEFALEVVQRMLRMDLQRTFSARSNKPYASNSCPTLRARQARLHDDGRNLQNLDRQTESRFITALEEEVATALSASRLSCLRSRIWAS